MDLEVYFRVKEKVGIVKVNMHKMKIKFALFERTLEMIKERHV